MTSQPTPSDTTMPDSGLYGALMEHALHQDRLIWDVSQILIALQGAVLASAFALRDHWLGLAILVLGAAITLLLMLLLFKYELDRDVNRDVMDKLASHLLPEQIKKELREAGKKEPFILISATPPRWFIIRGRFILRGALFGLILVDIVLAGILLWARYLLPS